MFAPHSFATSVTGCPKVVLTHDAYNDIAIIVQEVPTEVGWLGTVRKVGNTFIIEKIFLVEQEAAAATTEISAAGVEKLTMELLALKDGLEAVNAMRFWGHSHVNMGTSPSGQDNDQMKLFQDNGCSWFVRGIFNKGKRAQFDVYYFDLGFSFFDVEWALQDQEGEARRTFWKDAIKAKVKPFAPPALGSWQGGAYGGRPYDYIPGQGPGLPPYNRQKTKQMVIAEVKGDRTVPFKDEEEEIKKRWDAYCAEQDRLDAVQAYGGGEMD